MRGVEKMGEDGQSVQTSIGENSEDVMDSMEMTVSNVLLYIWKLPNKVDGPVN